MTKKPSPKKARRFAPVVDLRKSSLRSLQALGIAKTAALSLEGKDLQNHIKQLCRNGAKKDATAEKDAFSLGMELAAYVEFALSDPELNRMSSLKTWVPQNYGVRYETFQRFRRFLALQVRLADAGLSLIRTANQGRVLLPYYRTCPDKLLQVLKDMAAREQPNAEAEPTELPNPAELAALLKRNIGKPTRNIASQPVQAITLLSKAASLLAQAIGFSTECHRIERIRQSILKKLEVRAAAQRGTDVPGQLLISEFDTNSSV